MSRTALASPSDGPEDDEDGMAYLERLKAEAEQLITDNSHSGRNAALYRAAIRLYDVVKAEQQVFGEADASSCLTAAAQRVGLPLHEIRSTLKSAWERSTAADISHVRYFAEGVPGPAAKEGKRVEATTAREPADRAGDLYQARAREVWQSAVRHLWARWRPERPGRLTPVQWLNQQYGLSEDEIDAAGFGYNPEDRYEPLELWGATPRDEKDKRVWLPKGIVIPWWWQGAIHKLEVRRPVVHADQRWELTPQGRRASYPATSVECSLITTLAAQRSAAPQSALIQSVVERTREAAEVVAAGLRELERAGHARHPSKVVTVRGGANLIYNVEQVRYGQPVMLVEGVMNARAVHQVAGDLVAPVALGATSWGREWSQIVRLAQGRPVLLALDIGGPGDTAAAWWAERLEGRALRWVPVGDDPAAMLAAPGGAALLRSWVESGVAYALTTVPALKLSDEQRVAILALAEQQPHQGRQQPLGDGYGFDVVFLRGVPVWRLWDVAGTLVACEWNEEAVSVLAQMQRASAINH